ncbi:MAG: MliC family protein [Alphaproteobacteria bacterium]|nr:MliC family protein [Alphaproteobacteria bacterium]
MRRLAVAAIAVFALAACGPTSQPVSEAGFNCGDTPVHASFLRDSLILDIDGRRAELSRAVSGSGVRFIGGSGDDRVTFWEKGATATLTVGQRVYPLCARTEPDLTRSRKLSRER